MIENITFRTKGQTQSEIVLQHSSGEETVVLFNSIRPMYMKEEYLNAISELQKQHPDLSPKDELFGLFSWWFARCNLLMPFRCGTYTNDDRKRIGQRIREIREEKNIEAKHLALMTGITPANISRIEQGKHSVGLDILSKIADALGYKVELVKK